MKKRIKAINRIDLDFEVIRAEVRENLEITFAEAKSRRQRKLPYTRAIRAVCVALCICTAAAVLTFVIKETSFWNTVIPPSQIPNDTDTGTISPPEKLTDPGKSSFHTDKYDRFFAFATFVNPNVIANSELLNDRDKSSFVDYAEKSKSPYYIIYMGTKNDIDIIMIFDWFGDGAFEFSSNLDYRYEDVISEFEDMSNTKITNDFLSDENRLDVLTTGIYLRFKESNGIYIPYYESNLNNNVFVVDNQNSESYAIREITTMSSPAVNQTIKGSGITSPKNKDITKSFDSFFSFGTLSKGILNGDKFTLLSNSDLKTLEENMEGANYFDFYLGTVDGIDTVIVVNPYNQSTLAFKSNLNCKYEDIISAFEKISGEKLTNEFLSSSNYDENSKCETGGITLHLRYRETETLNALFFKVQINGKIHIFSR